MDRIPEIDGAQTSPHTEGITQQGEPLFLVVGKLLRPHGLKGEMLMEIVTDFPERLAPGYEVYLGSQRHLYRIRSCRGHSRGLIISFSGIDTQEQAAEFRNNHVFVRASDIPPLPEGEFYQHQLYGLRVLSDEGRDLGQITDILETGANDVLIIRRPDGAEVLLPNTPEVVLGINLEEGEMRVHLLPGLVSD